MPSYLPSVNDLYLRFSTHDSDLIRHALALLESRDDIEANRPHGLDVALNLLTLNVDIEAILAAILSDSRLSDYAVEPEFGLLVAGLVSNVKQLNTLNVYSDSIANQASQVEILRRMLLSTADDIRALLIKLAYRLVRLKNLVQEEQEIRHFIAKETLDLYAPIANRLGIGQLKWALEDYAFRYLEPEKYSFVAKELENKRVHREHSIDTFIEQLQHTVSSIGLQVDIKGRPKHIYSIWQKMQRKKLPIGELYDLLAVRVIVQETAQCYEVLGLVHQYWTSIPKEFDDYIANPKNNGYQSLHTVILDADNNRIEVQIRTREMHDFAELGVAAHWRYKEGSKQDIATEKSIASLRQLLEENDGDGDTLLVNFRTELFTDRVYVLTPTGQLIDLIKGATPLDFAYAIHTDVGHRCRGAKVNGAIVSLNYQLKTGEQVEILTANDIAPNPNWIDPNLAYLKTPRAIQKIKAWLKLQGKEKHYLIGQRILEQEVLRLGVKVDYQGKLLQHFNLSEIDKLYVALGRNVINRKQLNHALLEADGKKRKVKVKQTPAARNHGLEIIVDGTDNILTHFAQCCQPQIDDELTGFISHTNGIAIHTIACENIRRLNDEQKKQLVAVSLKETVT